MTPGVLIDGATGPHPGGRLSARIEWREAPSPVDVLLHCGWLTAVQAGDPRLDVAWASSSHALFRVTAPDGRAAVVKHLSREAAENGRSLFRELYVYRMAGWLRPLAAALPRPIFIDERRQILVIESLAEGYVWPEATPASLSAPEVGPQLGRLMGRWHRATEGVTSWPSPASGILHLEHVLEDATKGRAPATAELMRTVVADDELSALLREARGLWRDRCLIHGDIKRENWILRDENRGARLKVIDWELSGLGEPAWDVGSVLAEAVLESIREGCGAGAVDFVGRLAASTSEFLRNYGRNGLVDLRDRDACWQVVSCAAGRLLHVAFEWSDAQGHFAPPGAVKDLVERARLFVRHRTHVAAGLRSWAEL